jgi:hypothetical protein
MTPTEGLPERFRFLARVRCKECTHVAVTETSSGHPRAAHDLLTKSQLGTSIRHAGDCP